MLGHFLECAVKGFHCLPLLFGCGFARLSQRRLSLRISCKFLPLTAPRIETGLVLGTGRLWYMSTNARVILGDEIVALRHANLSPSGSRSRRHCRRWSACRCRSICVGSSVVVVR